MNNPSLRRRLALWIGGPDLRQVEDDYVLLSRQMSELGRSRVVLMEKDLENKARVRDLTLRLSNANERAAKLAAEMDVNNAQWKAETSALKAQVVDLIKTVSDAALSLDSPCRPSVMPARIKSTLDTLRKVLPPQQEAGHG